MKQHHVEEPLLVQEPLVKVGPRRSIRSPRHWVIFAVTFFVGVAPTVAGIVFGAAGIIGAVKHHELMPWWAAPVGVILIVACLVGVIVAIFGVEEGHNEASWLGLALAIAAWPGVIMASLLLTVVAPQGNVADDEGIYAITIEDVLGA